MSPELLAYWLTLAGGLILSGFLFLLLIKNSGNDVLHASLGFLAGIPLAFFFAKGAYLTLHATDIPALDMNAWFRLDPKEFSFVAGCIGFCLGSFFVFLKQRGKLPGILDQLSIPGCILIAVFRFGEIYLALAPELRSDVGLMTDYYILKDDPAYAIFNHFPLSVPFRKNMLLISVSTWEAVLILLLTVYVFFLWRRSGNEKSGMKAGDVFERCVFLLCAFRLFFEMFSTKAKFYFVHTDQVLCALIIIVLLIRISLRIKEATGRFPLWPVVLSFLLIGLNVLTQFFLDGKLNALFSEPVLAWLAEGYRMKNIGYAVLFAISVALAVIHAHLSNTISRTGNAVQDDA